MEVDDDSQTDPATPDLFAYSYNSDGRTTPDDTSSVDGVPSASTTTKKKRRGRPPIHLTGEPMDSWLDTDTDNEYKTGGMR